MELKHELIIEMWDEALSYNRTSVELKLPGHRLILLFGCRYNRTSVELKQIDVISNSLDESRYNRTSVELKPLC